MSLISRLSRLSYGNRIKPTNILHNKPLIKQSVRFGGHGPPSRLGFPHAWGGMVWFPFKTAMAVAYFFNFQMLGLIIWYKWDSIPYPAHRYNDENTTARQY